VGVASLALDVATAVVDLCASLVFRSDPLERDGQAAVAHPVIQPRRAAEVGEDPALLSGLEQHVAFEQFDHAAPSFFVKKESRRQLRLFRFGKKGPGTGHEYGRFARRTVQSDFPVENGEPRDLATG
jgi:hypothetical protein